MRTMSEIKQAPLEINDRLDTAEERLVNLKTETNYSKWSTERKKAGKKENFKWNKMHVIQVCKEGKKKYLINSWKISKVDENHKFTETRTATNLKRKQHGEICQGTSKPTWFIKTSDRKILKQPSLNYFKPLNSLQF